MNTTKKTLLFLLLIPCQALPMQSWLSSACQKAPFHKDVATIGAALMAGYLGYGVVKANFFDANTDENDQKIKALADEAKTEYNQKLKIETEQLKETYKKLLIDDRKEKDAHIANLTSQISELKQKLEQETTEKASIQHALADIKKELKTVNEMPLISQPAQLATTLVLPVEPKPQITTSALLEDIATLKQFFGAIPEALEDLKHTPFDTFKKLSKYPKATESINDFEIIQSPDNLKILNEYKELIERINPNSDKAQLLADFDLNSATSDKKIRMAAEQLYLLYDNFINQFKAIEKPFTEKIEVLERTYYQKGKDPFDRKTKYEEIKRHIALTSEQLKACPRFIAKQTS